LHGSVLPHGCTECTSSGLRICRPLPFWGPTIAAAWMFIGLLSAQGQRPKPTEYEVKAAYLYNFGKFIEWPASSIQVGGDSFAICVLGQDPFGAALESAIANETLAGKRVVARQIDRARDAAECRVLFISSSEERRLKEILASLGRASVLTVSDLPEFTQQGGMVQFVLQGDRVRFEVNSASAERAGLTLSSDLLKVAVNVRRSTQLGD
jgi:YfiR/HmsC-like